LTFGQGHSATITLSLRIYITDDDDYGAYRCVASNALGHDDGVTYLDGLPLCRYYHRKTVTL